jgi:hypothetical protein
MGKTMKKTISVLGVQSLALAILCSSVAASAFASTPVSMIGSQFESRIVPDSKMINDLKSRFDVEQYRAVKAQVIYDSTGMKPDHLLVYFLEKGVHRFEFARVNLNADYTFADDVVGYKPQAEDFRQQPAADHAVTCPDTSIQFIAFAPNDDDLEQSVTVEVAQAAEAAGLKTVSLLKDAATRKAYISYMSCPNLVGNFYDGDANTGEMTTADGMVSSDDFSTTLRGAFRYKVTNIWLACEAYNDPMLSSVKDTAQSQKYAAGINDLQVGPSDKTGACAMEAAIAGKPMTASFQKCYKQFDTPDDHWGFGGTGADLFNR